MVNMSAKFDKEAHNGLVSIVFTRSTHGRTEPQQRYYNVYPLCNALHGDNNLFLWKIKKLQVSKNKWRNIVTWGNVIKVLCSIFPISVYSITLIAFCIVPIFVYSITLIAFCIVPISVYSITLIAFCIFPIFVYSITLIAFCIVPIFGFDSQLLSKFLKNKREQNKRWKFCVNQCVSCIVLL